MKHMKVIGKAAILTTLFFCVLATAQSSTEAVFGPAEAQRVEAEQAGAILLSPRSYLAGMKKLDQAKNDFAKNGNPERVRKTLEKAREAFRTAWQNAESAKLTLRAGIESRLAAQNAEAARLAAGDWLAAEKTFNAATRSLENGNLNKAQKRHDEANAQYRIAEINAIRVSVLAEAWRLIAEIEQQDLERFAPLTINQAKQYAGRANTLILQNRYALDEPLSLAERATYEARHALRIATIARRIEDEELSVESLILDWESSLKDVAHAANIEPDFSVGKNKTSADIILLLDQIPGLRSDLKDRDALIMGLEDEIRELDMELGGASADRSKLIRRLEQQARVREQFLQIENMFASDEAIVFRDGDNLIVRLVGLSFASGSAELEADAETLLTKVKSAIDVFPQSGLIVEGHTDAKGNAEKNLALSEQRALAVKSYITDVMRIPPFRIKATGYGDTRPIANNRTADGRARNRRIDLIIEPNPASL